MAFGQINVTIGIRQYNQDDLRELIGMHQQIFSHNIVDGG